MFLRRTSVCLLCMLLCLAAPRPALASEHHGQITFNTLPVPGVTVTATHDGKTFTTVSDSDGRYAFADLPDGSWKIELKMTGFTTSTQDVTVASAGIGVAWELKMLPLDAMIAQTKIVKAEAAPVVAANTPAAPAKKAEGKPAEATEAPKPAEESAQSSDGFLVNGSVNNAATSQFSLAQAFGNTRKGSKGLYTGGLGLMLDNSSFDARPYSLSGRAVPQPSYNKVTATATFGGPIRIPHVLPRGPNFFVVYQWTRDRIATAQSGLVPTTDQRNGILPTGTVTAIDPVAQALLALYPLPNITGNTQYNYQVPITDNTHQDALQARLDKTIGRKDSFNGTIAFQNTRADSSNLFGFRDTTDTLGINSNVNWNRRINRTLFSSLSFRFSRLRTLVDPYFKTHPVPFNTSLIKGNSQAAQDLGPPTLEFASGITGLTDGVFTFNRNRTVALSPSLQIYRGKHNVTLGGDFRRQEYNIFSQSNPRGTYSFTGAATGSDFKDFLTGVADTAEVAYGNADKYFRQSVYDAYITDDWRLRPELTLQVGLRWEYGAPITELKNRLVNLDVAPGFTNVMQVLASSPKGPLTGQQYPTSLVRPDKTAFQPRLGVSWRPIPGSSLVIRAGYGIYADTSIALRNASRLAVQPPYARSLSQPNSARCPFTLANGFAQAQCDAVTFAVDPDFQTGYAQTYQVAAQRDLPFALQMTATYLGIKGAHGVQQFAPNTYPVGATNPCPSCPLGFYYRTTNGTSSRNAGSLQLRRRLRSGFTATAMYTWSKSIDDDAALGGQGATAGGAITQSSGNSQPAQNWRDLHAERSLSTFDQRNLLTTNIQYTSGMGLGGGTLLGGWRGRVLKEWTIASQLTAGSGLPENPVFLSPFPGTGFNGILRPDRTSASLYAGPSGHFLNAAAYAVPQTGKFGNAGRNSITGPGTFTFDMSLARTFRLEKKYDLDVRADATNVLNHPVYTAYNTKLNPSTNPLTTSLVSNPLFGVPISVNPMRSVQLTGRLRF